MAEKPASTGNINNIGDVKCHTFQPINVTGNKAQIILMRRDEKECSDISGILHDVQDPIESFTGRKDILANISQIIETNRKQGKMTVLSQINVVTGMGGIGKTETIRKYIYEFKSSYDHIMWINAETFVEAKNSFSRIAKKLQMSPNEFDTGIESLRDAVQEIYERLCKRRTLVIFDNADKVGAAPKNEGIYTFLPKAIQRGWEKPTFIVTSRIRTWKNISVIELKGFEDDECYQLLLRQLEFDDTKDNRRYAAEISSYTHGLPLAIQVVIGIVRRESDKRQAVGETNYTVQDFLIEFRECDGKFIDEDPYDSPVPQSILKIFNISFRKLEKEAHGNLAMRVLNIMSYLSPSNIPKELLSSLCTGQSTMEESVEPFLPAALLLLHSFSLVTMKSTYYQIHRLTQRVVLHIISTTTKPSDKLCTSNKLQHRVEPIEQLRRNKRMKSNHDPGNEILQLTVQRFEDILDNMEKTSSTTYEILQNGYQLAQHISQQNPVAVQFKLVLADRLEYYGRYTDSIKILKTIQTKETWKSDLSSPLSLNTLSQLARLYNKNGKYAKAVEKYNQVVEIEATLWDNKHPQTLITKHNLAGVLDNQGKYEEAVELYQQVLEAQESTLGQNHPHTLITKQNLAGVLDNQGKYEQAVKLYQNVLESQEIIMGPNHPKILTTKTNLAGVFDNQGKYDEALELHHFVLEAEENILGKTHPSTLTTKSNLALVLHNQGKYKDALELYQCVLEAEENILGQNHPHALTTKQNLAGVLANQGKYTEAVELYQNVLEAKENTLGRSHPSTLTTMHNLAGVLHTQEKYENALELYQDVLEARENNLGQNHPYTLSTKQMLAGVLDNQGKYEKAVELYRHIVRAQESTLRQKHPDILITKQNLAGVLDNQGEYEEAVELYQYVLQAQESTLGQNHPDTMLTTKSNLAFVLDNQGKYEEAAELYQYVLEAQENTLGKTHPDTLTTMRNLAVVLKNLGKYRQARELLNNMAVIVWKI